MGAEWSADNRLDGSKSESKGVAFEKVFVEVCGVPIERGYLRAMEAQGLVPAGTTASARPSAGWVPKQGLMPPPPGAPPNASPSICTPTPLPAKPSPARRSADVEVTRARHADECRRSILVGLRSKMKRAHFRHFRA